MGDKVVVPLNTEIFAIQLDGYAEEQRSHGDEVRDVYRATLYENGKVRLYRNKVEIEINPFARYLLRKYLQNLHHIKKQAKESTQEHIENLTNTPKIPKMTQPGVGVADLCLNGELLYISVSGHDEIALSSDALGEEPIYMGSKEADLLISALRVAQDVAEDADG